MRILLLLLLSVNVFAAEVILTQQEIDQIASQVPAGQDGAAGPQGEPGANGTVIMQADDVCFADIGGQMREWSCPVMGTTPPIDPPPPPVAGWPVGVPVPTFEFNQQRGPVTGSGGVFGLTLGPGDVYMLDDVVTNNDVTVQCNGTEANPAFLVGGSVTTPSQNFTLVGEWCIVEDTKFISTVVRLTGNRMQARRIEQYDASKNGVNIVCNNPSGVVAQCLGGSMVRDSHIHDNYGNDRHGVYVGQGFRDAWIMGNEIHHNSGNAWQACHQCTTFPPDGIYIARNEMYADREAGVGGKYANNVVVSENRIHDYVVAPKGDTWCTSMGRCSQSTSGSNGPAIVIGADGVTQNVKILNNEIYNVIYAIRIEDGLNTEIRGNTIYNVLRACLSLEKSDPNVTFADNTCRNVEKGINNPIREFFTVDVDNNVFENVSLLSIEYEHVSICNGSTLTNNTFTNSGPVACQGRPLATTAAEINSLPGASGNVVN